MEVQNARCSSLSGNNKLLLTTSFDMVMLLPSDLLIILGGVKNSARA